MPSKSTNAMQFVYDANHLRRLLDRGADKVVFTITVAQEVTKDGRKVGALNISATGTFKGKKPATRDGGGLPGCPVPPCIPN